MEQRKRMDNLDFMKAFGILMVISLHVPLWQPDFMLYYNVGSIIQYAFRIIAEGVPIFVMINGFLLLKKKNIDTKSHAKKMLKLFFILILWGGILATTGMFLDKNIDAFTLRDVIYAILNIQVGAQYTGVLWFLQNLLAVYLIYPALWYLFNEKYNAYKFLFGIVTFFVLGINTLVLLRDVISTVCDMEGMSRCIEFINRFNPVENGWYVFYFMLGGMVWHNFDVIKSKRILLGGIGMLSWPAAFATAYYISISTGVTYNQAFNYGSIYMVAFLLGVFALTIPFESNNSIKRFICSIGQNTFGMYLSHFLFIFLLNHYWEYSNGKERLVAYLLVCVGSYAFSIIVKSIPIVKSIIDI